MDENTSNSEKDAAPQNLLSSFAKSNNEQIRKINDDHLRYVERHLDLQERISVIFLLVADRPELCHCFVENIKDLLKDPQHKQSDLLLKWKQEYQREQPDTWRDKFIEALCIIEAKKLLRYLRLNTSDLIMTYLPHIRDRGLFIHRIVKLLFFLSCRTLDDETALRLIEHVAEKYPETSVPELSTNVPYLEANLMQWIAEGVVSVGEEKSAVRADAIRQRCHLGPIMQFLKKSDDHLLLKDKIQMSVDQFNGPSPVNTDDGRSQRIRNEFSQQSRPSSELETLDRYEIRRASAGILLIINQMSFHRSTDASLSDRLASAALETRYGTDQDKNALRDAFTSYGYEVVVRDNAKHDEILEYIRETVDRCVPYDSIAVCILSHGHKGVVYGADSVAVELEAIQDVLASDRLLNKPKILLVQACQGRDTMRAVQASTRRLDRDGPSSSESAPRFSDLLMCVSSFPGYTSFRDRNLGSWFIQTLCRKLTELSDLKHFVDILTVVSREVQNLRDGNECMVPIYNSVLRRDLFLPRKLQPI